MRQAKKIALIGAESTGKTTICKYLAKYYNEPCVLEYAREYLENIGSKYTYNDVISIAQKQIHLEQEALRNTKRFIFIDTELIIIKIWFEQVFKKVPIWIQKCILEENIDLYLFCEPDIAWEYGPLRENGGKKRIMLSNIYKDEIRAINKNFHLITGNFEQRFAKCINIIENLTI